MKMYWMPQGIPSENNTLPYRMNPMPNSENAQIAKLGNANLLRMSKEISQIMTMIDPINPKMHAAMKRVASIIVSSCPGVSLW